MKKLKEIINEFFDKEWKNKILSDEKVYKDMIIDDLLLVLKRIIPYSIFPVDTKSLSKFIKLVKVKDNPFKFNITITMNGKSKKFIAEKIEHFRTYWVFNIDGKEFKTSNTSQGNDFKSLIQKELLTPLQYFKIHVEGHDFNYHYADDNYTYSKGRDHSDYIKELYNDLNKKDQEKAFIIYKKESREDISKEEFEQMMKK